MKAIMNQTYAETSFSMDKSTFLFLSVKLYCY